MSVMFSEEQIRVFVADSIAQFGAEHTHDFTCRTWRGKNWSRACDCALDSRVTVEVAS